MEEKDVFDILWEAGGIDAFLQYIMKELEHCDDMIYKENLSSSHFIYWKTRKDTLSEIRDYYCNLNKHLK